MSTIYQLDQYNIDCKVTEDQNREVVIKAAQASISDLVKLLGDENTCDMVITAVVRGNDSSITARELVFESSHSAEDPNPRFVNVETSWRHKVPETAMQVYGTMSDAIALSVAEDEIEGTAVLVIDIGQEPLGAFSENEIPDLSGSDDD